VAAGACKRCTQHPVRTWQLRSTYLEKCAFANANVTVSIACNHQSAVKESQARCTWQLKSTYLGKCAFANINVSVFKHKGELFQTQRWSVFKQKGEREHCVQMSECSQRNPSAIHETKRTRCSHSHLALQSQRTSSWTGSDNCLQSRRCLQLQMGVESRTVQTSKQTNECGVTHGSNE
jgi:hypothetical protein